MKSGDVSAAMVVYNAGDARRVNHLLKVYGFARTIGEREGLDARTQEILEIAALTHDIGIRNSERKYGNCSGEHQQQEGPPEARALLASLGADEAVIERVCWLIAHHHTYTDIQGMDYQILIEADFLVNAFEDEMDEDAIRTVREKLFRTNTGIELMNQLYFS
ncbi:MAG TPA: HD domain-containing protein [Clostridia bacterium]|nr:HD domain-containing protein [Clostridia bacterium]